MRFVFYEHFLPETPSSPPHCVRRLSDIVCSASPGQRVTQQTEPDENTSNHGAGFRNAPGAGAVQPNAAYEGVTRRRTARPPLCGLISCTSSSPRAQQRAFPRPRSSAVRASASTQHRRRDRRPRRGHGAAENHTGTQSSHLKFTDRAAVSGGEQGRLKCDTVRFALRLRKLRRDVRDKQKRSATLRSYLIRHQSRRFLPARLQVNYLGLGQNLQQRQKMAFFSTVRGLPILDHVILFCRLVHGANRVSTSTEPAGPAHFVHGACPAQAVDRTRFYFPLCD